MAASTSAFVIFGSTPNLAQSNTKIGGPEVGCTDRGICDTQGKSFTKQMTGANGKEITVSSINVNFSVVSTGLPMPNHQNNLVLTFFMDDLINSNQPNQAGYFLLPFDNYTFASIRQLPASLCQDLGLDPKTCILPSSSSVYFQSQDPVTQQVIITLTIALYNSVTGFMMLGNNSSNQCDGSTAGICSVSQDLSNTNPISTTFTMVSATNLYVGFDFTEISNHEQSQEQFFSGAIHGDTSNYPLTQDFPLTDPLFAPLGLAAGATISAAATTPILCDIDKSRLFLNCSLVFNQ